MNGWLFLFLVVVLAVASFGWRRWGIGFFVRSLLSSLKALFGSSWLLIAMMGVIVLAVTGWLAGWLNALLLVFAVAAVAGVKRHYRQPAGFGRPIALACVGLIAVTLTIKTVMMWKRDPSAATLKQLEAERQSLTYTIMRGLGNYLAGELPGRRALLIRAQPTPMQVTEHRRALEALRGGLTNQVIIVAEWSPEPSTDYSQSMLGAGFTARKIDEAIRAQSGIDLVISLVGLPPDYPQLKTLRPYYQSLTNGQTPSRQEGLQLVVMRGGLDRVTDLRELIEHGYIHTAILPPSHHDSAPANATDPRAVFFSHFEIVNARRLQDNPKLLAKNP